MSNLDTNTLLSRLNKGNKLLPVSVDDVTRLMAKYKTIDQVPEGWPQSSRGLMPPEEPLQDPWVDPVTALSAGVGGALPSAIGKIGTQGLKALAGPAVSGLASGLMDYPVGALTEVIGEKYPKAALPANIALGLASGMTFERLAEEAMQDPRAAINYAKGLLADDAGQITWHGTPHQWTPEEGFPHGRPRLDKIGTGEGAQAYGHGWYSADAQDVGKTYLKDDRGGSASGIAKKYLQNMDRDTAIKRLESHIEKIKPDFEAAYVEPYQAALGMLKRGDTDFSGSLYKLDIPDDISDKLLDWDKPLSEQSEYVKKALEKAGFKESKWIDESGSNRLSDSKSTGKDMYDILSNRDMNGEWSPTVNSKAASDYLASIGIPGNKYLDQMSRGGFSPKPITDSRRVDITKRAQEIQRNLIPNTKNAAEYNSLNDELTEITKELAEADSKGTYNYVLWDQPTLDRVKVLQRNNETLDPIGNSIADLNQADPTHKLKFDGIQEGFGTIPSKYQITPQDGPAKGATFLVDEPTQDAITKRLLEMIAMRTK